MSDSVSKDVLQYIGEDDIYSTDFENATIISINEAKIRRSLISKDVMQYMKENDLYFTDFEKATIIYNSWLSVNEKHLKLKMLAEETDDVVLKKQIEDRLFDDRKILEAFMFDTEGYVYDSYRSLDLENFHKKLGSNIWRKCFADPKSAYEHGKLRCIGKYKIISNEAKENNKDLDLLEKCDPRNPDSVIFIERYPVAGLFYTCDGTLYAFENNEIGIVDKRVQNETDNTRFENAPINMPNPFERGDIVENIDGYGPMIIETSQDEWENKCEALKDGGFSNERIECVEYNSEGEADHFRACPLFLEKYEPKEDDEDPYELFVEEYDLLTYGRDAYKGKIPFEYFTRFCETLKHIQTDTLTGMNIFRTRRLILLPANNERDSDKFLTMLRDDGDFREFSGLDPTEKNIMVFKNYFDLRGRCYYAIYKQKPKNLMIGFVGIRLQKQAQRFEVEFYISKPYRNRRYCTEAFIELITEMNKGNLIWIDEDGNNSLLTFDKLYATTISGNKSAAGFLRNCMFKKNSASTVDLLIDPETDDSYTNIMDEYVREF